MRGTVRGGPERVRYDAAVLLLAEPVAAAPIRLATAADAVALVVRSGSTSRDAALLDAPRPDEVAVRGETTRLGAYASRLWLPMLDAERRI